MEHSITIKQLERIRTRLQQRQERNDEAILSKIWSGGRVTRLEDLTKFEASDLIQSLKDEGRTEI